MRGYERGGLTKRTSKNKQTLKEITTAKSRSPGEGGQPRVLEHVFSMLLVKCVCGFLSGALPKESLFFNFFWFSLWGPPHRVCDFEAEFRFKTGIRLSFNRDTETR